MHFDLGLMLLASTSATSSLVNTPGNVSLTGRVSGLLYDSSTETCWLALCDVCHCLYTEDVHCYTGWQVTVYACTTISDDDGLALCLPQYLSTYTKYHTNSCPPSPQGSVPWQYVCPNLLVLIICTWGNLCPTIPQNTNTLFSIVFGTEYSTQA